MPLAASTLVVILAAWAAILVLVVAGLAFGVRRANPERSSAPVDEQLSGRELRGAEDRRTRSDRRTGSDRRSDRGDRRIGLPDLRAHAPDRRRGPRDRRSGIDRRSGEDRRHAVSVQAG
jgi:hypothetical protein